MHENDPYTLEDIDFNDDAFNDFMSRFGDLDPNKEMIQTKFKSKRAIKTSQQLQDKGFGALGEQGLDIYNGLGLGSDSDNSRITGQEKRQNSSQNRLSNRIDRAADRGDLETVEKLTEKLKLAKGDGIFSNEYFDDAQSFEDIASGTVGAGISAAPHGLQMIDNIKGGQFDTDADSGGPGKAGGAIMSGAATGAQLADSLGFKDPIVKGIFAVGGGLVSTFSHTSAMKEWRENQRKQNLSDREIEKATREEEFARSEGLMSMGALKGLRQKQLGILNA